MDEKIKIMVVDDHTVVRKGLCSLLSADKYGIDVVGDAVDGRDAVEKARHLMPDVILMDLMMPNMNGIEATRKIREHSPDMRVLVLTSYGEDDLLIEAIEAGAFGYLIKDASPDELVSTIKSVYMDRFSLPAELARKVMLRQRENRQDDTGDLITDREQDVLVCIAKGYSNKQIAEELVVSIATVRTHVSSLLRKLGFENRTQLAIYARENDLA